MTTAETTPFSASHPLVDEDCRCSGNSRYPTAELGGSFGQAQSMAICRFSLLNGIVLYIQVVKFRSGEETLALFRLGSQMLGAPLSQGQGDDSCVLQDPPRICLASCSHLAGWLPFYNWTSRRLTHYACHSPRSSIKAIFAHPPHAAALDVAIVSRPPACHYIMGDCRWHASSPSQMRPPHPLYPTPQCRLPPLCPLSTTPVPPASRHGHSLRRLRV